MVASGKAAGRGGRWAGRSCTCLKAKACNTHRLAHEHSAVSEPDAPCTPTNAPPTVAPLSAPASSSPGGDVWVLLGSPELGPVPVEMVSLMASGHMMQLSELAALLPDASDNPELRAADDPAENASYALADLLAEDEELGPLLPEGATHQAVHQYVYKAMDHITDSFFADALGPRVASEQEIDAILSVTPARMAAAMAAMPLAGKESLGPAVHYLARERARRDVGQRREFGVLMIAYTIASMWQPEAAA